jgi:hypothetical protein
MDIRYWEKNLKASLKALMECKTEFIEVGFITVLTGST